MPRCRDLPGSSGRPIRGATDLMKTPLLEDLPTVASHVGSRKAARREPRGVLDDARTVSLLYEIGQELSSILDRNELLSSIGNLVRRLIDYQIFGLYVWDENSQTLTNTFALEFEDHKCCADVLRLGEGVCGTAAQAGRAIRIPDVTKDPRFISCDLSLGIRSELAVPMLFKGRLIGVVNLESVVPGAFSAKHERILETLAPSIAIALENSRLYEELDKSKRDLEADLRMAREVQKGLLPNHSPLLAGVEIGRAYRPAKHLGGDFYDFLLCKRGHLNVAVGDVSGKSTPAALLAALSIGILHSNTVKHPCSPAEMLRNANSHLKESGLDGRFLAMTLASYEEKTGIVRLANAGLPHPLLVRDGQVHEIPVAGFPLGLFSDVKYDEETLTLSKGDLLVISSDGIHESRDCREQDFGPEELEKALLGLTTMDAQDVADRTLEASLAFADGCDLEEDDRTVVVLKGA